jgi:hypothetical protein
MTIPEQKEGRLPKANQASSTKKVRHFQGLHQADSRQDFLVCSSGQLHFYCLQLRELSIYDRAIGHPC